MTELTKLGEFITSEYEILRKVLKLLCVSDLENCSKVCVAWKKAVKVTVGNRRTIQCVVEKEGSPKPFILSDAGLVLTFVGNCDRNSKDANWRYMSLHYDQFPTTLGMILSVPNHPPLYKPERGGPPLSASVRFPPWDNTNIFQFKYSSRSNKKMKDLIKIPEDALIKAVIVITRFETESFKIIDHLRKRQSNFPFAGGILHDSQDKFIYCYIFWGSRVNARSCILKNSMVEEVEINERIKEFSKDVQPSKHSIMFVFSCIERDSEFRSNVKNIYALEKRALDEHFPNCNRVGFLSCGELGMDSPPLETIKRRRTDSLEISHSFATSLLYISYE